MLHEIPRLYALLTAALLASLTLSGSAQAQCEPSSAYLAWTFGSELSLAAVFYDRDAAAPYEIEQMTARVRPAANHLGADIPPFPLKTGAPTTDTAKILHYLLTATRSNRDKIRAKHGLKCSMLYVVAMSSNTLLLVYVPGEPEGAVIAETIRDNAPSTGIPSDLWMPMIEKIEAGASYSNVRDAIIRFHDRVAEFLNPF